MRPIIVGVGLAVAVGAAAAACSSESEEPNNPSGAGASGSGGQGTGATGPSCGNATFTPAECQTCLEGACCDELAACGAACLDWIDCANACDGDVACKADCDDTVPDGVASAASLDTCVAGACDAECGGSTQNPNAICDSGLSLEDDPACASCLGDACCAEYNDCADDEDCFGCLTGNAAACDATELDEAVATCGQACNADC